MEILKAGCEGVAWMEMEIKTTLANAGSRAAPTTPGLSWREAGPLHLQNKNRTSCRAHTAKQDAHSNPLDWHFLVRGRVPGLGNRR